LDDNYSSSGTDLAAHGTGWRRELEEAVLTSIYLATLASWLADGTAGSARTQRLLRRLLTHAERAAMLLGSGSAAAPLR
jgi:ubiquinone biosynthesis protein COQ9